MHNIEIRRLFRLFVGIFVIIQLFHIIPLGESPIDNVEAGSSWLQTTQEDFFNGTLDNVVVSAEGNVTLGSIMNYIEDDFDNESKISSKEHLILEESSIKLERTTWIFGGSTENDHFNSLEQTSDGGYILAGKTKSYGAGLFDFWLIKAFNNGTEEWNKTFGGTEPEWGTAANQTSDGGYVICGGTFSFGAGERDAWLVKTDSDGNEQWNKTYGGIEGDRAKWIQQTSDGGYIMVGDTMSYGSSIGTFYDLWLIKTDSNGIEQWNRTFGGSDEELGLWGQQIKDGGFIITGTTDSFGAGSGDLWVIKTNETGVEQWNETFGGSGYEMGNSIVQTTDGGYIIGGNTTTYGVPSSSNLWLLKINSSGSEEWNSTFGDAEDDIGHSVKQTFDGGYIVAGSTISFGKDGLSDGWFIKTNATGAEEWNRTRGGSRSEGVHSVHQSPDGTYIAAGESNGSSELVNGWLFKINQTGSYLYFEGEFTSTDLLEGRGISKFGLFHYNVSILGNLHIQFSHDLINWYDSNGASNGWDVMMDGGINSTDLSNLDATNPNFYYRVNYSSGFFNVPILYNISMDVYRFFPSGSFISQAFYAPVKDVWKTISWTSVTPEETDIRFQIRSSTTEAGLGSENFVGPGGSPSTNYTDADTNIWSGHNTHQWIQFKAYLIATNEGKTPILQDVTISYNQFPQDPELTNPQDNSITNDNTPTFSWNFNDQDGIQGGFQVIIDDDAAFSSVDYDSGQVASATSSHTINTDFPDGIWYWKVRTRDDDGDWGGYSDYRVITIDSIPPLSFKPTASPSGWTNNPQPVISFTTTDSASDVDRYEIKIDTGSFTIQTSPYILPQQNDGIHNVTVRAFDLAGNYVDGYVDVYIDSTRPTITDHFPIGSNILIDSTITLTFSEAMNKSSCENAFSILPLKTGAFSWTANTLTFTPTIPLDYSTQYTVILGTGAKDLTENNLVSDMNWQFTTVSDTSFRPYVLDNSWGPTGSKVTVDSEVSISFSEPMQKTQTQAAFSITPSVEGTFRWEGTTLKFLPTKLTSETQYSVSISPEAQNMDGVGLIGYQNWSFITEKTQVEEEGFDWNTWEPIITAATILISVFVFLFGFLSIKKKRGRLRQYLEKIDDLFNQYNKNYQRCQQELITLRETIRKEVKDGKLEESHYLILDKKLDDYLLDMKALKEESGEAVEPKEVVSKKLTEYMDEEAK
jgi:hypothetical protein